MKTLLIATVGLVFIGGYFYYLSAINSKPEIEEVKPNETAVPQTTTTTASVPAQIATFENADYNFTFTYRVKPYGYSVFENNTQQNAEQGTLFGVTLVRTDDYNEAVKAAAEGNAHDGPPSMSVSVFTVPEGTNIAEWLVRNKIFSNCQEGSVMPISVASEARASCLWDGLYAGETRALIEGTKIYLLTGTRENMETTDGYSYAKDFMDVVESFSTTN